MIDVSNDPRERQWLHLRLSLAVVKGNTVSIGLCEGLTIYLFFS